MAGIAVAGSLVADVIKMISYYPQKGMLSDISSVTYGIGGCVANTAVGIKKLDPSIEVKSIGLTGKDDMGAFLRQKIGEYGIDVSLIQETDQAMTSFSDVMTVKETVREPFFIIAVRAACLMRRICIWKNWTQSLSCSGTADFWMPLMPAMKNTGRHLPERFMI